MTLRDAVDFSAQVPYPEDLARLQLDPLPYVGVSRPNDEWFARCRALGVAPHAMFFETYSERSQEGYQAGVYDCDFAEARADERGHDGSLIPVVSDGNYADAWDCSGYAQGWAARARRAFFPYGSEACCRSFIAAARTLTPLCFDGEMIPETWGNGRLISQHVGPSPIDGTDLDYVHAQYWLGEQTGGDDVIYVAQGNSTTNPDVQDGQEWIVVGQTAEGTVLVRGEGTAGTRKTIDAEQLGRISKFVPASGPADPVDVDAVVNAALAAMAAAHADEPAAVAFAIRAALTA